MDGRELPRGPRARRHLRRRGRKHRQEINLKQMIFQLEIIQNSHLLNVDLTVDSIPFPDTEALRMAMIDKPDEVGWSRLVEKPLDFEAKQRLASDRR